MSYRCPNCGRQSLTYEPRTSLARCLYYADCGYSADATSLEALQDLIKREHGDTGVQVSSERGAASRIEGAASS